jgi:hypothetical protein
MWKSKGIGAGGLLNVQLYYNGEVEVAAPEK